MKCAKKIISVALVLMLALSVMVLPTSAAEPVITADVVAEYQGQTSGGYDYYKFSVYLDSSLSLATYQLNITWDNAVWQMIRATNFADQAAFIANMCIDQKDSENIMYTASDAYQNYGGGNWDYSGSPNGYTLMPGDGTPPTFAKISNDNMGTELTAAGYTGLYTTWMLDVTDDYLTLSGGDLNGFDSPTSGRQMVISWYMRLKDGVAPGSYEVGFNAKQFARLTGTYTTQDSVAALGIDANTGSASIAPEHVTYTNAVVKVGEAGPAVTKTQAEVKMTLNEEKTAVDYAVAPFQFRVISSISEDDWNTYFNGDGSNINSVGFVAYKGDGAFDMETAKSVAMGGSAADYQAAKTDYIQKVDGQAANFGARIDFTARENVKDVTYIAFVQYDTDQYAFYDASFDAALNTNYDTIVSQYARFIAG
jgi:hypothetical protein